MTLSDHIVREEFSIDYADYRRLGKRGVKRLMKQTETKALAISKRMGVKRPVVCRHWDLDVMCAFTDYPMYLLGPKAPRIRTAEDVFDNVWHLENPRARYEVVVDDQDEIDRLDREWMAGLVAQARAKGLKSLSPQWAPNVIEKVRKEAGL